MLSRQKLGSWTPAIVVFAVIIVLSFLWFITFQPSAWEQTPNYLQMYIEFILTRPIDAFLMVSTGSGGLVSWLFIPTYATLIIHTALYRVRKQRKRQYIIVNRYYLVYLVFLALFAISFQNASQYYNWYWNPKVGAPGYVDTWTHITSSWLLGALAAPLALERYFGWNRKSAWFFIFATLAIAALVWEIGETIDVYIKQSSAYFNYPMDSLKDIILGVGIGTILSSWIYERLVIDLEKVDLR
jgi:hypothetical protein